MLFRLNREKNMKIYIYLSYFIQSMCLVKLIGAQKNRVFENKIKQN